MEWKKEQLFEKNWWGNCCNTYGEEEKQLVYAQKMGLKLFHNNKSPYNFDMQGKVILDIGGGPCSLLLKCENVSGLVVDPCDYPKWVDIRYKTAGITFEKLRGEDIDKKFAGKFDEIWIYNVLQHVDNPKKIIDNARDLGIIIRIFEWIENGISEGHPHNLTEKDLNNWLKGEGKVEQLDYPTLKGLCYYGIFKGNI